MMEFETGDTVILHMLGCAGFYIKEKTETYILTYKKLNITRGYCFLRTEDNNLLTHRKVLTEKYIRDFRFVYGRKI